MKPHPRIRKTIKWGGAAVTVLLVVIWIGSGWWALIRSSQSESIGIGEGGFSYSRWNPEFAAVYAPRSPRWGVLRLDDPWFGPGSFHLSFAFRIENDGFFVPLWPAVGLVALTACIAWRLDTLARRRARLNLCPKCNYDRTGLATGAICPECGRPPSPIGSQVS